LLASTRSAGELGGDTFRFHLSQSVCDITGRGILSQKGLLDGIFINAGDLNLEMNTCI